METRSLKIFCACALGAGIGALIALQLQTYFWWVGMLIGGAIGYLSYEFKNVLVASVTAWRTVTNWKPDVHAARKHTFCLVYGVFFMTVWTITIAVCIMAVDGTFFTATLQEILYDLFSYVVIMNMVPILFSLATLYAGEPNISHYKDMLTDAVKEANPASISKFLLKGLWKLISLLPAALRKTVQFFYHLIILIHSDIRLLCGLDAAIGSAIGYYAGNALIGALTGGVFGVLNFEILSKRILKTVPNEIK